ncbi:hypothetical protein [Flavobacterium sp. DG2-3]|uniref:hypothetical protein n=1 Tax=Flavobacterium sp. DG2-3 TaxID=3068317 RepID=UPI00273EFE77|nr:hypothetical protein [Flavobacterium sp. DG2-3]MDP5200072.1 hypothetical protein [Flavobacterium sp. DG2-3]
MKHFLFIILIVINSNAQDCPTRIGDFEINSTKTSDLEWILPSYTSYMPIIENLDEYKDYIVSYRDVDEEYAGSSFAYLIKPDYKNVKSWYNLEVASVNDSTEVIFIPSYKTDNITIKNVLLKFYNDKLYFIRASLNKNYTDIILEKYKGRGYKSEEKKTPNTCKNPKLKKYHNSLSQYFFASEENKIRAMLTFDFKINKYCETVINDRIEIFDFDIYIRENNKIKFNMENMQMMEDDRKKNEKEQKLKRF